jgi:hypothetical protein
MGVERQMKKTDWTYGLMFLVIAVVIIAYFIYDINMTKTYLDAGYHQERGSGMMRGQLDWVKDK